MGKQKFVFNGRELVSAMLQVAAYGMTALWTLRVIGGLIWHVQDDWGGPISLIPFVAILWIGIYYLNRRWPGGLLVPTLCLLVGLVPAFNYLLTHYF